MIKIQCCKLIIVVSCINFTFILGRFRYQLFWLPVTFICLFLQPRCSLVIIVGCSNIIDSCRSRYQLFQLPINFMECFSTAYLFYMELQILVVSWTHLFYSKGVFGGINYWLKWTLCFISAMFSSSHSITNEEHFKTCI